MAASRKAFIVRQVSWYLRNPLQNFGKYVFGVGDQNYTVVGTAPIYASIWSDVDPVKAGWKVSTIHNDGLSLCFLREPVPDLVRRLAAAGLFGSLSLTSKTLRSNFGEPFTLMRWTIGIGTIALVLWLAYSVWPFFAVYRLANAVQVRDVAAVNELVDFPALRRSLTTQIIRTYLRITGKTGQPASMLEKFAVGVGASVADPIIAKLISPEALLDLLQNGRPPGVFSDNAPSIEGLSSQALGNVWRVYTNSELGIARFFIAVPVDKPPRESFRLGFCLTGWRWKLCSAELPEQLQFRLAQEISKSEHRRP